MGVVQELLDAIVAPYYIDDFVRSEQVPANREEL